MTEQALTRHGLENFVRSASANDASIQLTIRADLGHINLRGDSGNADFVAAVELTLGQPLPLNPNTVSNGSHSILWLGPNEWLILSRLTGASKTVADISRATGDFHSAVNDLSGGQIAISMSGKGVRELLARGCTLDLHPRKFGPGMCAQSGLAKAAVLVAVPDEDGEFLLVVRRSFSDYLVSWLIDAADGPGIRVKNS